MTAPQVAELLADLRVGHAEFQLDHFVIAGNGVTLWGSYQQALRELRTREVALREGGFAARRAEIRLARAKQATRAANDAQDRIAAMEASLEQDEAEAALQSILPRQRDLGREHAHLVARAVELRAALGPLSPARIQQLDAEHWYTVVRRRASLELLANGRVEPSTIGLIASLPGPQRSRILTALSPGMRPALLDEAMAIEDQSGAAPC